MTAPGPAFQECTGSCLENVPAPKVVSSNLGLTDGLTVLARIEIVTILVHYQTTLLHFTHAMKPSDPLHCCSLKGFFCVACVYNFITKIILNIRQHQWWCLTRLPQWQNLKSSLALIIHQYFWYSKLPEIHIIYSSKIFFCIASPYNLVTEIILN